MDALAELDRRIAGCRACPRLVAWREEVARTRRAAFADQTYWGRPVPGFGPPDARPLMPSADAIAEPSFLAHLSMFLSIARA